MNLASTRSAQENQDRFGRAVAVRLSSGAQALPHDITERLRSARVRAVAQRKIEAKAELKAVPILAGFGKGSASLGLGDEPFGLWGRLAAIAPVVLLVIGLIAINSVQSETRARELAEIDSALLTDALPPAAYADPGFVRYLTKIGRAHV